MREFVTLAISLGKRISGERDSLVFLFTEENGIIPAQAISGSRIKSKLMPHLETLRLATVRIVGNTGYRIADALRISHQLPVTSNRYKELLRAAYIIRKLLPFFSQEPELWRLLRDEILGTRTSGVQTSLTSDVLCLLGYDPHFAGCALCSKPATHFAVEDATFYCERHGKTQNALSFTFAHEDNRRA